MRITIVALVIAAMSVTGLAGTTHAARPSILRIAPPAVHFGTKAIGSFTILGTTITNSRSSSVRLLVSIESMPDDFSFGMLPGSTCPPFEPALLGPGESCRAVVGFRPSDYFAGQEQHARLRATAADPGTGEVLESVLIEWTGTGR